MRAFEDLVKEVMEPETEDPVDFRESYSRFYEDVRDHLLGMGAVNLQLLQREGDTRFSTALPLEDIRNTTIAIVGVGGLGNHVWRILLGMGFRRIHLFDDDIVEAVNVGPQMHRIVDIGLPKVEAARNEALAFRGIELGAHKMTVTSLDDLTRVIGSEPDILIGLTDSVGFRNAIIDELETRRTLELFMDIRMSLGDWNAFCFTPAALERVGDIGTMTEYADVYKRYRQLAVFSEEEAVQEHCTARSIVYTGANVASFVGAYLHWWFVEGKRLVNSRRFIGTYYEEDRVPGKFSWLTRFSSRDFFSMTLTTDQRRRVRDSNVGSNLRNMVVNRMKGLWNGVGRAVPGDIQIDFRFEADFTKAFLDMAGDMHIQRDYCFGFTDLPRDGDRNEELDKCELMATLDLNFTKGEAVVAVDVYGDDSKWTETRLRQTEMVSAPPMHTEKLDRGHAADVMMRSERGTEPFMRMLVDMYLRRTDNEHALEDYVIEWESEHDWDIPLCCVIVDENRTEKTVSMIALRLSEPKFDSEEKLIRMKMEAWKATKEAKLPMRISTASVPVELAAMTGWDKYCSGWTPFHHDLLTMSLQHHEDMHEAYDPPIEVDYSCDYPKMAYRLGDYEGSYQMVLSDVPDGATVIPLKGGSKSYWKGSEGNLSYLLDGTHRRLYVSPRIMVRVVEWP